MSISQRPMDPTTRATNRRFSLDPQWEGQEATVRIDGGQIVAQGRVTLKADGSPEITITGATRYDSQPYQLTDGERVAAGNKMKREINQRMQYQRKH